METSQLELWCSTGKLPEAEDFYSIFLKDERHFNDEEGHLWDFKDAWPYSLSDDYFGCIARLICAFANSSGGVIIFGVHDVRRTGGHNSVRINLDRFNVALSQLLGELPNLVLQSYKDALAGDVDVLLVRPRAEGTRPLKFKKTIGNYRAGTIWVRAGHEVRIAEPPHYPVLFCRAHVSELREVRTLDGSIPPSPATLKQRFVGRTEVLDHLFHWLEASDEPRTYLHGKGGSGKTTIAYEFARLIKDNGEFLKVYGGKYLDNVIFVSAKEKSLLVTDRKIMDTNNIDFSNEVELLRSILIYGGWTNDSDYLEKASIDVLRENIKDFFNHSSSLIIIDDIDTLTTKGIDPGADFLYRTLCRSTFNSKIVYTLRNSPSQSIGNAIEVPGLNDIDYQHFVKECVDHFGVKPPDAAFINGKLSEISERRPLVIESIIALRRTSGDYEQAVELFQQQTGDAIRDYVFLREWDALRSNEPRLLLAALSELLGPSSFSDMQSVLQYEASKVSDAIGEVREMFLQIDEVGRNALYTLAPLTKAFIRSKRTQLVGYNALRERVKAFQRHVAVSNPRVANIVTQIERLLPTRFITHSPDKIRDAYKLVSDKNLPPFVTEDPLFRVISGYVLTCKSSASLTDIRAAFQYALNMKLEPEYKYLLSWFNAEKNSGVNDGWSIKIADFILEGKRYTEHEKMEMIGRKATALYARAQERLITDPSDALKDLVSSLELHLRAYKLYYDASDIKAHNSARYARNTAYLLFGTLARSSVPWEFVDCIEKICTGKAKIYIDPLEMPIYEALVTSAKNNQKKETRSRMSQRIRALLGPISSNGIWLSNTNKEKVISKLQSFQKNLTV